MGAEHRDIIIRLRLKSTQRIGIMLAVERRSDGNSIQFLRSWESSFMTNSRRLRARTLVACDYEEQYKIRALESVQSMRCAW